LYRKTSYGILDDEPILLASLLHLLDSKEDQCRYCRGVLGIWKVRGCRDFY
jgi:hypothetical protein